MVGGRLQVGVASPLVKDGSGKAVEGRFER
jgi:hypothetical protein